MRARCRVALALGVTCFGAGAGMLAPAGLPSGAASPAPPPPNVVVVMTDDQTNRSMRVMPNVRSLIAAQGASFPDSFVNWPLCCPSRSTFLSGQYAHNHGVLGNEPPNGGFDRLDSSNTLPVWLEDAGYYTGLIGKYLNGYEGHRGDEPPLIPSGWTEWHGATITNNFYAYELNENFHDGQLQPQGTLFQYGTAPEEYSTDVYTQKALDFLGRRAPSPQPFFLWLAYLAPHGGGPNPSPNPPSDCRNTAKPAPRHAIAFDAEPLPLPPSFNEFDVSDKPAAIRNLPQLTDATIADIRRMYRCRLESLLAVDEGVQALIQALEQSGELTDTLIVFADDNGFHAGEHRIRTGKNQLYEESIRAPLLLRGPGIPAGVQVRDMAVNADLAPTILDAAGVVPGRVQDGRSLLPFAQKPSVDRGRELLIETNEFSAIRTHRYIYAERSNGEKEMYDLVHDPYELQSLHADPAYAGPMARLASRLADLRTCAGRTCLTKPSLHLDVSANRKSNGCLRRPVRAVVAGEDLGAVAEARFVVNGQFVGKDGSLPYDQTLPWALLQRNEEARVRAVGLLTDGRRMTMDRRIRACV